MSKLRQLSKVGGPPVGHRPIDLRALEGACDSATLDGIQSLLELKNGFYAFESALHVWSDAGTASEKGLVEWNSESLWKSDYQGMASGLLCFAEDVFGMQFCLKNGSVHRFDPETGACETMAPDLEHWAGIILDDFELWTGHSLAHEWQSAHGAIPVGARLLPTIPFVLGGEFTAKNCHAVEAVKGMRYRASIAVQIRDLPDGATVKLRTIE